MYNVKFAFFNVVVFLVKVINVITWPSIRISVELSNMNEYYRLHPHQLRLAGNKHSGFGFPGSRYRAFDSIVVVDSEYTYEIFILS